MLFGVAVEFPLNQKVNHWERAVVYSSMYSIYLIKQIGHQRAKLCKARECPSGELKKSVAMFLPRIIIQIPEPPLVFFEIPWGLTYPTRSLAQLQIFFRV